MGGRVLQLGDRLAQVGQLALGGRQGPIELGQAFPAGGQFLGQPIALLGQAIALARGGRQGRLQLLQLPLGIAAGLAQIVQGLGVALAVQLSLGDRPITTAQHPIDIPQPIAQFRRRLRLLRQLAPAKPQAAPGLLHTAAGHGSAGFQQLPIQRHDPMATQERSGLIQPLKHHRPAKHILKNVPVAIVKIHQVDRIIQPTRHRRPTPSQGRRLAAATAANFVQGQEGDTPSPLPFQDFDRRRRHRIIFHHQMAQPRPGRNLQGHLIARFHLPQIGHQAANAR